MKKSLFFLVATLLFVSFASAQVNEQSVALVTSVNGDVVLLHNGSEASLALGSRLSEGAMIRVTKGSVALVFFSGELLTLSDEEELHLGVTLEASKLRTGGSVRGLDVTDGLQVSSGGFGDSGNDVWQAQLASVSGIRGDAMAIALAPRLTLSDPLPRFSWFDTDSTAVESDKNWVIVLRDENGTTLVTQPVSGKAGIIHSWKPDRLPAAFVTKPGAQYTWGVFPAASSIPQGALEAAFVYVDEEGQKHAAQQRAHLSALLQSSAIDLTTYHTLSAAFALDERERLFSDAVPHLLALAAIAQGREWAGQQLAHTLLRFGGQAAALAPMALRIHSGLLLHR